MLICTFSIYLLIIFPRCTLLFQIDISKQYKMSLFSLSIVLEIYYKDFILKYWLIMLASKIVLATRFVGTNPKTERNVLNNMSYVFNGNFSLKKNYKNTG